MEGHSCRLVLSRRDGESIHIGEDVVVTVHGRGTVKLMIEAPDSVRILRSELVEEGVGDGRSDL